MNQKGVFGIVLAYAIFFMVLVLFFAIIIPAIETFNIAVWAKGDSVLTTADNLALEINDSSMRTAFQDTIQAQQDAATTNVDILGAFNQYAWAIIAVIMLGVYFLFAKQVVEVQSA